MLEVNAGTKYRLRTLDAGTFLQFLDDDGYWKFIPRSIAAAFTGKYMTKDEAPKDVPVTGKPPRGFKVVESEPDYSHFLHGNNNPANGLLMQFLLKYPEVESYFIELQKTRAEYLELILN